VLGLRDVDGSWFGFGCSGGDGSGGVGGEPEGHACSMRDRLQDLFVDEDFTDWFPVDGRGGVSPTRLALVSVLQYAENLTDRQAARRWRVASAGSTRWAWS